MKLLVIVVVVALFGLSTAAPFNNADGFIESIVNKELAKAKDLKKAAESIVGIASVGLLAPFGGLPALRRFVESHRQQLPDTFANVVIGLIDFDTEEHRWSKRNTIDKRAGYEWIKSIVDNALAAKKNINDVAQGIVTIIAWEGEPYLKALKYFVNDQRGSLGDTLVDLIISLIDKQMPGLKRRGIDDDGLIQAIIDYVMGEKMDLKKAAEEIVKIASWGGAPVVRALKDFVHAREKQLGQKLAELILSYA